MSEASRLSKLRNGEAGRHVSDAATSRPALPRVCRPDRIRRPDFETGTTRVELAFEFSDPNHKLGRPIAADFETYSDSDRPVPAAIRDKRLLTTADFQPTAMLALEDGTFDITIAGEPMVIHLDSAGRVLQEPWTPTPSNFALARRIPADQAKFVPEQGLAGIAPTDEVGVYLSFFSDVEPAPI